MPRQLIRTPDPGPPVVRRESCIKALGAFAPLSERFISLLKLPDRLIQHGPASFSTGERGMGPETWQLIGSIKASGEFPPSLLHPLPPFGIVVAEFGGTDMCAFTDYGRRILVAKSIVMEDRHQWEPFQSALSTVLIYANSIPSCDFIVSNGKTIRHIRQDLAPCP